MRAKPADESIATHFCALIGHVQVAGNYVDSWQPHPMAPTAVERARMIAKAVTDNRGGLGIFGVSATRSGSEVNPRPHDTGMVTMTASGRANSQDLRISAL